MKRTRWKQVDALPGQYTQLRLFPPTPQEILTARVNELEAKLERQRKGQFGRIGAALKQCRELEERLAIIEKGICKNTCEIIDMAIM